MEKFENKKEETAEEKIEMAKKEEGQKKFYAPDGSGALLTEKEYEEWKEERLKSGETFKKD